MVPRADLRLLASSVAALTLLTSIPYVAGHRLDDGSSVFLDTLVYEQDFNSYCAFVRESAGGAWLFYNPFTSEPHRPTFLNLEFLITGKAAALLRLEAGRALQVQRAIAGVLLAFGLWGLGARVITTSAMRRVALLAALTGGGFGWMKALPLAGPHIASIWPIDLYAGAHPFFWLFLHPHFAMSGMLVVLALGSLLEGERTGRSVFPAGAGILAAVAGLVRPYDMLFVQAAAVFFAATMVIRERRLEWRAFARRLLPAVLPIPVLAYCVWLFRFDPVFQWWGRQGVNPPPPLPALLLGLGLLLPLLVLALAAGRRRPWTPAEILMACAAGTSLLLTHSHPWLRFSFQFVTTLVVPALLLALARTEAWMDRSEPSRRWMPLVIVLLAANALTSVTLWATHLREVRAGAHRISRSDLSAFSWLESHSRPRDVVLAALPTANRIPRYTHDVVVVGYAFSTVRYSRRLDEVELFYRYSKGGKFRRQFLADHGVRYVVYGPDERALGRYDPAGSAFLAEVFRDGETMVYEVRLGSYPRVGQDDHAGVERYAAEDEEPAAAEALGQRPVPPHEPVVPPQAERHRLRLAARQEAVGRRITEDVAEARSLRPRVPLDEAGGAGAEHVGQPRVQLAVERGVPEIAVPARFHSCQALAALMGWQGATAATLPPSATPCSQSMSASSERTGGGERTRRTTPRPSSGARPSTPTAAAYTR